jgi:hypothetical protein
LLTKGHSVDWWFVFKFNSAAFPGCDGDESRACVFGGDVQAYKTFGQQYLYASSEHSSLQKGSDCAGDTVADPIGATFDEIYNRPIHYVVWNDQFYDDPPIVGCTNECGGPWGHSKGLVAWNDFGDGLAMQVTTPSWPASGSAQFPRRSDGNTLGCTSDNNVKFSQHFFAVKLSKHDLMVVLKAVQKASVVTDPSNPQIVNNGGPSDVQALVAALGKKSDSITASVDILSSGVKLISKPSHLNVPPWQLVSAELGSVSLRVATWWSVPKIYTTTPSTRITCWNDNLGDPGPVEIATTGVWDGTKFGLTGGPSSNSNHAKIGVSTTGSANYVIFGDMNQQGATLKKQGCAASQNGRGGLFFVLTNHTLFQDVTSLIAGGKAPTHAPTN